jgi:hypothetical protein
MSSQSKELIAAADAALGMTALKRLTVMFNRIAIHFADYSKVPVVSPDLNKRRNWLAELGVLFDLDIQKLKSSTADAYAKTVELLLEDNNLFTKTMYGMSLEEIVAARTDEAKAAELKKRTAEAGQKLADGAIDPVKIMEIAVRLTTNSTRMLACQLRDVENVDSYAVLAPDFSSFEQDDPRIKKHHALRICIGALPVPVDHVPWEQLIEYRKDPEAASSFVLIKDWISEAVRASFTVLQVEETLESLLNRFRRNMEIHRINTTTTRLFAYVVTTPEFLQTLAGAGPDWGTRALFSMDPCKIGLLEGELTAPGSILGFLLQTDVGL